MEQQTPIPPNQGWENGTVRFALRAASSLILGGWGFTVPFYFVQDCSYEPPITSSPPILDQRRQ